jgi:hypothetical protein
MTGLAFLQFVLIFGALLLTTKPLGVYMRKVFDGEGTFLTPVLGWLEAGLYRLSGIDPAEGMGWRSARRAPSSCTSTCASSSTWASTARARPPWIRPSRSTRPSAS